MTQPSPELSEDAEALDPEALDPEAAVPADDDVTVVPELVATGDDAVDAALMRLAGTMVSTLDEQLPAYEHAHRALQDRLADVEG